MKKRFLILSLIAVLLLLVTSSALADTLMVSGGGQIYEAPEGAKRPDWSVISFGGWSSATSGEWQINFHNVSEDSLDKASFHGTNLHQINWYLGNGTYCDDALNLIIGGTLNGEPNHWVVMRFGDFGSPGKADTVRIELYSQVNAPTTSSYNSGTALFDTYFSEFGGTPGYYCVGAARTWLDSGNITITAP